MDQELFARLKADPGLIESVLNPGRYLHEADPNSLEVTLLPSGFTSLDKDFLLLKDGEGELVVFCGEASMGKSALMLKIAFNISKSHPVHIFSLEDSYESIVRRRIAGLINRPITAIQLGLCRDQVKPAIDSLKEYNFFIDDTGGLTVDEICDRARSRYRKIKSKVIVIDHLQVIGMNPSHSRALEIGTATYKLKALAKELKTTVILASQMNRQYAGRDDKKPRLSDLKESSSIEQNSDVVVSVYREYRYTKLRPQEADISVLKNRNGAVGDCILGFAPTQADFYEIDNGI